MLFYRLFPLTVARKGTCVAFWLCCLALFASLPVAARNNDPKRAARPVARLVSSSSNEEGRPRARLITSRGVAPAGVVPSVAPSDFVATGDERRVFTMVNDERRDNGLRQLVWDGELSRMARLHSEDMARLGQLAHEVRGGMGLGGRAAACGITGWRLLGENVAYNYGFDDPQIVVVERWMESDKHRENILNGGFTHAGLGIAKAADGRVFFTQVFITR